MNTVKFDYAKLKASASYRRIPHNYVFDGGDAGLGDVEVEAVTLAGVQFSREEAEGLQFGNDQTLWDTAEHLCWLAAYGPRLPSLKAITTPIADASRIPEFAAALAGNAPTV